MAGPRTPGLFARYVDCVSEILHDVPWIITINEPNILALFGLMTLAAQDAEHSRQAAGDGIARPAGDNADDDEKVTISRNDAGDFIVAGKALEKLVAMTNFNNDEAVRRFQYIWRLKGLDEKLRARGIKEGMTVHIGDMAFDYQD